VVVEDWVEDIGRMAYPLLCVDAMHFLCWTLVFMLSSLSKPRRTGSSPLGPANANGVTNATTSRDRTSCMAAVTQTNCGRTIGEDEIATDGM